MAIGLSNERGVTLVELLIVMTLSLGVLGATLTTFDGFMRSGQENDARNDSAELARNALDAQARQLRNLAKRVASPVVDSVSAYDLIFQTAEPTKTWVRYCLDTAPPASPARGRLWVAELAVDSSTTATPISSAMREACPGSGWTTTRVLVDHVTNRAAGQDRPLYRYGCSSGTTCTGDPSTYDQVINISAQAIVDTTPGTGPAELRVRSGVYLRNQNQAPVARFVATPSSGSRTVLLNASASSDFEGRTLNYYWFDDVLPAATSIDCTQATVSGTGSPRTLWGAAGFIGEGITLAHTFPGTAGDAGTTRNIGLVACDPGDRFGTAGIPPQATIAVQIPA